ncbi:MAG: PilZ domain-containing protein [Sandaracinaceae bacterium]
MADEQHFRRTARQPIELSVQFRRDEPSAQLEMSGRLVDLGLGGVQIACRRAPPIGQALRVLLVAPSAWDPLELPGTVRWVDDVKQTFGVEFEALRPSQASALYELLAVSRFAEPST